MNYETKIIKQDEFPEKLRCVERTPKKLYAVGNLSLLYEDCFGIVGTRNPTEYGIKICKEFTKEFALRDIPIVSGLAIGIDEIAHQTVLEYNSKTIGVIGCGFKYYVQSKENKELFYEIINQNGLILSEYDKDVENSKENYPQRNRIIAAISEGVLVVEAAYRSGSSITARLAEKYGKRAFAVPGRVNDKMSVGTNNLIKKGANLVLRPEEIIKSYPQFENKKRKNTSNISKTKNIAHMKNEWKEIIDFLKNRKVTLDELQLEMNKDIRVLMKILSEMEIEGIIEQEIGLGYVVKR